MAELKTRPTQESPIEFLDNLPDERQRTGSRAVLDLMAEVTQAPPVMWGGSIIGFGRYRYHGDKEWMLIGFSPRKNGLALYIMEGLAPHSELMARLGKHKTGVGCLYIKTLEDVDLEVLRELVVTSVEGMAGRQVDK